MTAGLYDIDDMRSLPEVASLMDTKIKDATAIVNRIIANGINSLPSYAVRDALLGVIKAAKAYRSELHYWNDDPTVLRGTEREQDKEQEEELC